MDNQTKECVKNIITFPDESKFNLDELGFTREEMYLMLSGLEWLVPVDKEGKLKDKIRTLIYAMQNLETVNARKKYNQELEYDK